MKVRAVILAAGQGTRMHSNLPKVLHPIMGVPMLRYTLEAAKQSTNEKPVIVIGHGGGLIQQTFANEAEFVIQEPQLGTGHAVLQAKHLLDRSSDMILVTYGDMPLLTSDSFTRIIENQKAQSGPITMLSTIADDPRGFGRVLRADDGSVSAIVEEAEATSEQLRIHELNTGVYCFSADWLWNALEHIPLSPKGEYYLTDLVKMAVSENLIVQALRLEDPREGIGINTRQHLAEVITIMRDRINQVWMLAGVTLIDPQRTYIEPGVKIGQDTTIWPDSYLFSGTVIGDACTLGPNAIIRGSQIGTGCNVECSIIEESLLDENVHVGPYAHLRSKTHLEMGVHVGNFGETKNSRLGAGTKMGHFSYIGDADIADNVNIGAGTITCNFDGVNKNKTMIGAGAFIGSDTMLVAPLSIGEGACTGAGAVVTKDVPANTLAVGVPARSVRKIKKSE
jgi:bifunctional UDP-N-acetylglucosamine pyrophosphorylase/glucosamine-1-phosphate N-acetyltransferase